MMVKFSPVKNMQKEIELLIRVRELNKEFYNNHWDCGVAANLATFTVGDGVKREPSHKEEAGG